MCESNDGEVWKPIPGFKGYEASNLGRVRSVKRKPFIVMRQNKIHNGYSTVQLYRGGERWLKGRRYQTIHVARAVLLAFCGEPSSKKDASHIDGNSSNNNVNNLVWEDRKTNLNRFRYGTKVKTWERERDEHGNFKAEDKEPPF